MAVHVHASLSPVLPHTHTGQRPSAVAVHHTLDRTRYPSYPVELSTDVHPAQRHTIHVGGGGHAALSDRTCAVKQTRFRTILMYSAGV